MNGIRYAHPHITPTLQRVINVLDDMPAGATALCIGEIVYGKTSAEGGLRPLRTALQLGIEQGLVSFAGTARRKPGARGPAAFLYALTHAGAKHVEVVA